jgi:hypothetical protein
VCGEIYEGRGKVNGGDECEGSQNHRNSMRKSLKLLWVWLGCSNGEGIIGDKLTNVLWNPNRNQRIPTVWLIYSNKNEKRVVLDVSQLWIYLSFYHFNILCYSPLPLSTTPIQINTFWKWKWGRSGKYCTRKISVSKCRKNREMEMWLWACRVVRRYQLTKVL